MLRLALLLVLASVASGCATRGSTAVTRITAPRCDAQWQLSAPQGITLDPAQGPQSHRIDPAGRCLTLSDGSAVSYAVFRLPRYRGPWTLELDSQLSGTSLFAPEALLLDAGGKVLREVPFERFAMRGDRLQTTVFFSEDNVAEQYLLLHSAGAAVGRDERHVVSSSFIVPLFAGAMPFLFMQGTESEGAFTYSHSGTVSLLARSQGAALRRNSQARAVARSEMGVFTR